MFTIVTGTVPSTYLFGFLRWLRVKNLPAMQEMQIQSLGWEDPPGEGNGNPLQYSCLENPCSLAGYRPGGAESDMTEQLNFFLKDTIIICGIFLRK